MARNRADTARGFPTPAALARCAAALLTAATLTVGAPAKAQTASLISETSILPDLVADPVMIVHAVHSSSLLNLILPDSFKSAISNMWLYEDTLLKLDNPDLAPSEQFSGLVGKVRYRVNHMNGQNSTFFEVFIDPAFARADFDSQTIRNDFPVGLGAVRTSLIWVDKTGRQFFIDCWNAPKDQNRPPKRTVCQAWEEGTQTIVKTVIDTRPIASREVELDNLRDSFDMIRVARETLVRKIYAVFGDGTIQKL